MKKKLLIVDPSDKMVELIYNSIKSMEEIEVIGYCECIEDALNTIKTEKPDIVTTEIEFNDKVDYEILKYIKENDLNIKTMVITKNTDPSIKEKLKEFDVSEYLEKPFQPDFISKRLFSILEDLGLFTVDKNENLVFVRKYPMERVVLEAEIKNNELPLSSMKNRERVPTHKKELLAENTIRNRKIKKKRIDRERFENIDDVLFDDDSDKVEDIEDIEETEDNVDFSPAQKSSLSNSKDVHNEEDLEKDREEILNGEYSEETRDSYTLNTIKSNIIQQEDEEYYEEDTEDEDDHYEYRDYYEEDDYYYDGEHLPAPLPMPNKSEELEFMVFDLDEDLEKENEQIKEAVEQKETYANPSPSEETSNTFPDPLEHPGEKEKTGYKEEPNKAPQLENEEKLEEEPEEDLVFVIENKEEKKNEEISESKVPEILENMKKKNIQETVLKAKKETSVFGGIPNIINQNLGELEKEIFEKPKEHLPKTNPKDSIKVSIAPPRNFESTVEVRQPTIRISEMKEPVLEENKSKKEAKVKEKSFSDKLIKTSEKLNSFLGKVFKK